LRLEVLLDSSLWSFAWPRVTKVIMDHWMP
jgi:hypothetical protein